MARSTRARELREMSGGDVVLAAVTIVGYAAFSSLLLWEAWISWRRRR